MVLVSGTTYGDWLGHKALLEIKYDGQNYKWGIGRLVIPSYEVCFWMHAEHIVGHKRSAELVSTLCALFFSPYTNCRRWQWNNIVLAGWNHVVPIKI